MMGDNRISKHRTIVIRGEQVRLYKSRGYWFANQGDRTFCFYPDDGGWHLVHEPQNRLQPTSAGTGRTMQQAVDNSALPPDMTARLRVTEKTPSPEDWESAERRAVRRPPSCSNCGDPTHRLPDCRRLV